MSEERKVGVSEVQSVGGEEGAKKQTETRGR